MCAPRSSGSTTPPRGCCSHRANRSAPCARTRARSHAPPEGHPSVRLLFSSLAPEERRFASAKRFIWTGALGRFELVALDVADLHQVPRSVALLHWFSKFDQEEPGVELPIPPQLARRVSGRRGPDPDPARDRTRARYSVGIRSRPGSSPAPSGRSERSRGTAPLRSSGRISTSIRGLRRGIRIKRPDVCTSRRSDIRGLSGLWRAPQHRARGARRRRVRAPSPTASCSSSGSRRPIKKGPASSCSSAVGPARVPSPRSRRRSLAPSLGDPTADAVPLPRDVRQITLFGVHAGGGPLQT